MSSRPQRKRKLIDKARVFWQSKGVKLPDTPPVPVVRIWQPHFIPQTIMAENVPPPNSEAPADARGKPYVENLTNDLRVSLRKRAQLLKQLEGTENKILDKETEYLEGTPNGNILSGFDNYTKGTGAGGPRRRGNQIDSQRVFSQSSLSYNPNVESPLPSASSTPAQTAPTPVSTSFLKGESASNHATPTSASSASRTGVGVKKNKKNDGDDSENDIKEVKKARTSSAFARK